MVRPDSVVVKESRPNGFNGRVTKGWKQEYVDLTRKFRIQSSTGKYRIMGE